MIEHFNEYTSLIIFIATCIFTGGGLVLLTKTNSKKLDEVQLTINKLQLQNVKFDTMLDILQKNFNEFHNNFNEFKRQIINIERDVTNIGSNANYTSELLKRLEQDTKKHADKIMELEKKINNME